MKFDRSSLEDWMRDYYESSEHDLGSSGVEPYSFGQLCRLADISLDDLHAVDMKDSDSYGGYSLRQAISARWGDGNPAAVMATHGSSEAIFLAMCSLLHPGDEVITLYPSYHQLYSIPQALGCKINYWRMDPDQDFRLHLEQLKALITSRTKMVILNFPHNPTGYTLTLSEYREVLHVVSHSGAYLLWDAAFSDLVYDAEPLPNPLLLYDRTIATGTFSKAYGMPGLRFGWCIADPQLLQSFVPLRDRMTLHLSPIIEFIAEQAIHKIDLILHEKLSQARANLDVLENWVRQNSDKVQWTRPKGGVTAFVKFVEEEDTEALCSRLSLDSKTLVVPGKCFHYPGYVRLGFGDASSHLLAGLREIEHAMASKETYHAG